MTVNSAANWIHKFDLVKVRSFLCLIFLILTEVLEKEQRAVVSATTTTTTSKVVKRRIFFLLWKMFLVVPRNFSNLFCLRKSVNKMSTSNSFFPSLSLSLSPFHSLLLSLTLLSFLSASFSFLSFSLFKVRKSKWKKLVCHRPGPLLKSGHHY